VRDAAATGSPPVAGVAPGALAAAFPGVGRFDLEPEDASAGAAQLARDTPSPLLVGARTVGQRFRASADHLYRIDVRVGTDGRPHAHRLRVRVAVDADPDARPLREAVIAAGALADDAWAAVEFPPLAASAGRDLYVWVQADGAAADDAITLWTYVHGWGEDVPGGLHLDHRPAAGSLTYRTFHREPSAAAGTLPAAACSRG
jgi:hypothetical protein